MVVLNILELLSYNEVELAASLLLSFIRNRIESVAPVDTHQTYHREHYPHTDSGTSLYVERIESSNILPAVSAFEES